MHNNNFPTSEQYKVAFEFSCDALNKKTLSAALRLKKLAEFGIFRMPVPAQYNGLESSSSEICDAWEALAEGTDDNGLLFAAGAHLWAVIKPLLDAGSAAQKSEWLPKLLSGEMIGAHAASEAEAGSDIMSLKTRYETQHNHYILNGSKMWITNAPIADLFIVFATCDERLHYRGISAFLVSKDNPGLRVAPAEQKMGLESALMSQVFFENCRVEKDSLLGKPQQGAKIFQTSLSWERTFILAPLIGGMRRQIKNIIHYANQRKQFGRKIAKFQSLSHRIATLYANYWQARQVLRKAAYEIMHHNNAALAEVAKLTVSKLAIETHLECLQCYGGAGYLQTLSIEQDIRDALGSQIYSGTSDIQKNIIANRIGL